MKVLHGATLHVGGGTGWAAKTTSRPSSRTASSAPPTARVANEFMSLNLLLVQASSEGGLRHDSSPRCGSDTSVLLGAVQELRCVAVRGDDAAGHADDQRLCSRRRWPALPGGRPGRRCRRTADPADCGLASPAEPTVMASGYRTAAYDGVRAACRFESTPSWANITVDST